MALIEGLKSMLHNGLKNEGHISLEQCNKVSDEADAEIERGDYLDTRRGTEEDPFMERVIVWNKRPSKFLPH